MISFLLVFLLMLTVFSPNFRTFKEWFNAADRNTRYGRMITSRHKLSPRSKLKTLRETNVSQLDISQRPFNSLSVKDKDERHRALQAKSHISESKSLGVAAEEHGLTLKQALRHLGKSIVKKKGQWQKSGVDNIQRCRSMISKGKRIDVIVDNLESASLISKYDSALSQLFEQDKLDAIEPFKDKFVVDVSGVKHYFETDVDILFLIQDQVEEPEFKEKYYDK